jgi:hypothetical protein
MSRRTGPAAAQTRARDHGLRRVRGVTGWITALATVGSVTLAGGYAAVLPGVAYSRAASPGRPHTGPPPASAVPAAGRPERRHPAPRPREHRPAPHHLRPPAQPPATTQAPSQTVSGGS